MPYTIRAECPCCGKKADGLAEIENLFGWRVPNDKTIPQSYCRECRNEQCKAGKSCKVKNLKNKQREV